MNANKVVMREAWRIYRTVCRIAHLPHKQRISEAMKIAWKNFKGGFLTPKKAANTEVKSVAKTAVLVWIVPNWLMHEKALFGIRSNVIRENDVERETAKAIEAHGEWFPKSVCERKVVEA